MISGMQKSLSRTLLTGALATATALTLDAQDTNAEEKPAVEQPQKEKDPLDIKADIKQLNENEIQIGKLVLNKKTREITFDATVEQDEQLLEYLVVNQHGKVHEALFITELRPFHLNVGLKLLGYKESKELFRVFDKDWKPTDKFHKVDAATSKAAKFDLFCEWNEKGVKKSAHVNQMIINATTMKPPEISPWVYGGSYLLEGLFKADSTGDMMAIFTDRGAVANFSGKGREDDTLWTPNPKRIPQRGTKVTLRIKPHKVLGDQ